MLDKKSNAVLAKLLEKIELPEGAYEKAERRYQDIGEWLHRDDSKCADFDPHVFSQGSFRLGTANRPYKGEEYDLDMGCNLRAGLSKEVITQAQLKVLVGDELKEYKQARNIKEDLAEKKRCWRLEYADGLSFHMDIVPCIPESDLTRTILKDRMIKVAQLEESLASDVSSLAVSITDNTDPGYKAITNDWRISNPEGYARWFESRMRTASDYLAERERVFKASIDKIPYYQWKTPLQSSVQLLKRHRDTMFKGNEDSKPISVIITTLAARTYRGEKDLASTLSNILNNMEKYIQPNVPLVPNPVNPAEDFADKWYSEKHAHLKLRDNFFRWLFQAKADLAAICSKDNSQIILEAADRGFSVDLDQIAIDQVLGLSAAVITSPTRVEASGPRPWFKM
ncbi:MAG TPA: nucleotidyltransferase [Desulfobacteraceae bacterium]|nr:nucleotidyltransferase [Desulfobacteraceae bacterium]HPJ67091.1 nucleotidyltransferase [Desulfobacteraceae bacterium]HPQ29217.1 nucleotidyltransferase [Desulfobacteraceae bacterium]